MSSVIDAILEIAAGKTIVSTPTVSASPDYSLGDAIGGKITLASVIPAAGKSAELKQLFITDIANVKPQFTILIFNSDPSAGTYTDNGTLALSTDKLKVVAKQPVVTADYVTISGVAFAQFSNLDKILTPLTGVDLYYALLADAGINFATAADLQIVWGFRRC